VPTVRQVLAALRDVFIWGAAFMAQEFNAENREATRRSYAELMAPVQIQFESHVEFKKRVPQAVGLIRTGDTTQYGNIIVESA